MNGRRLEDAVVEDFLNEIQRTDAGVRWAYSVMGALCRHAPDLAWPILLRVVATAPDDLINQIAAGPVEDFIVYNAEKVIGLVEAQAERDPRFRWVLRGVWQGGLRDEIWARVVAASRPDEAVPGEYDLRLADDEAGSSYRTRTLEVVVDGLPPASPDDPSRKRLSEAIRGLESRPQLPIEGPVGLTLIVRPEPGLEIPPVALLVTSTIDVLVDVGVLASPSLVWDLECHRATESVTSYEVRAQPMPEEQVEALSTVGPEWTAASVQEMLDQARSMFPDVQWPDFQTPSSEDS